ncbi:hypothetical protein ACFV0T_02165 [Streptomyces sp. NPDC059582]|uniref:hypothetical protein n=1 Tax=Streptomyces sp. NPDC059582 TaxID=3346875 RepID=UPI0036BFDAA7
MILFGLGFVNSVRWVAAAVLVLGATRHGRDRGGGWIRGDGSDLGEYRDYANRRDFAVLGGASVTNTGPSEVTGDLGVSTGTSVTGFPPGQVHGTSTSATPMPFRLTPISSPPTTPPSPSPRTSTFPETSAA